MGFAALHFTTKASPVWALVSRALCVLRKKALTYRSTFVFYLVFSIPVLSVIVQPADPINAIIDKKTMLALLAIAIYISFFSVFITWLAISKNVRFLQSGSSIGVAVSFSVFPLFFLLYFLAGPILIFYFSVIGFVHGKILTKVHDVKFST